MADERHVRRIREAASGNAAAWNSWRQSQYRIDPTHGYQSTVAVDLSGADLHGVQVFGLDLADVDLSNADLRQASFHSGNLRRAKLMGADLSGADLRRAVLDGADLSGARLHRARLGAASLADVVLRRADLAGANLIGARLQSADLEEANLANCLVYGVSVWDANLTRAHQSELVITQPNEPRVAVDNLQVAQFVHLLLNHQELRHVLDAVTKHGVLLLGRFGEGGLNVLTAVAEHLRTSGYLPMIFDFERPRARSYTETVQTLAGLARFVIVDLSGPSVPQELQATVPHLKIPFVPILESGRHSYAMFADLLEYAWVLPIVEFTGTDDLIKKLPDKIIAPAEKRIEKRQASLKAIFGE